MPSKYFKNAEADALRKRCRKVTDQVVDAWIDALKATDSEGEPDHDIRIKAANALADRGYGKPAQQLDVTHDVSPDELFASLAKIAGEVGGEDDADATGEAH